MDPRNKAKLGKAKANELASTRKEQSLRPSMVRIIPPLGSAPARLLCLLGARLAAPGSAALP